MYLLNKLGIVCHLLLLCFFASLLRFRVPFISSLARRRALDMAQNLVYRSPFEVNGTVFLRTRYGERVVAGSILDSDENPIPPLPLLRRTYAALPGGVHEWELVYREEQEPTNNLLAVFGQLPVDNGRTLRPFAECFPHLVRYTDDTCDKIVIVREGVAGDMTVRLVIPTTALARLPHD